MLLFLSKCLHSQQYTPFYIVSIKIIPNFWSIIKYHITQPWKAFCSIVRHSRLETTTRFINSIHSLSSLTSCMDQFSCWFSDGSSVRVAPPDDEADTTCTQPFQVKKQTSCLLFQFVFSDIKILTSYSLNSSSISSIGKLTATPLCICLFSSILIA